MPTVDPSREPVEDPSSDLSSSPTLTLSTATRILHQFQVTCLIQIQAPHPQYIHMIPPVLSPNFWFHQNNLVHFQRQLTLKCDIIETIKEQSEDPIYALSSSPSVEPSTPTTAELIMMPSSEPKINLSEYPSDIPSMNPQVCLIWYRLLKQESYQRKYPLHHVRPSQGGDFFWPLSRQRFIAYV